MTDMFFASQNGREIPKEDKIFGISNRAKAMIAREGKDKVVNATIGALLDDDGKLMVLSSVSDVFKTLDMAECAEYAPIAGTPGFREAVKKDLLRSFQPTSYVEAVASPGGTGALKNAVSNYSATGDSILVADWYWGPYKTIAQEHGRNLVTFRMFDENENFDTVSFEEKVKELLAKQERLVVILNTPAHNPTGYAMDEDDWKAVSSILGRTEKTKKITLVADVAYIDFAGEEEESRMFLPFLEKMPDNVLVLVAHSLSKSYTLYGMRCGALICMAKTREIAEEFKSVCEFSSRGSWSNCARAPQVILQKIYEDDRLLQKVMAERKNCRDMLLKRGAAFKKAAEEAGLEMVPFRGGFFATVPCEAPDKVSAQLETMGIFTVPFTKGIRVSLASVKEERCRELPMAIKKAIETK